LQAQTCKKKKEKKRNINKKGKCLDKYSHTAASTWIKTRRQISTWNWLNLQNKNEKTEGKRRKMEFNKKNASLSISTRI
jgi:hypothetical protein